MTEDKYEFREACPGIQKSVADARIARLLGLLEQAEEIVDWVLNPKDELNYTVFASLAAILKAKIEKEKAK